MRNICMLVSYDGTAYSGFQTQPSSVTIQEKMEEAIKLLTGESVKITASGRTDAGVHARGQVINFLTSSQIPIRRWTLAINARLPADIIVNGAAEVDESFHSTRSAIRKTYRYTIRCGRNRDVFQHHTEYHHYAPLDVEKMRQALQYLLGEHDFTSFCSIRSTKQSHVRTLYAATITEWDESIQDIPSKRLVIEITGNGFLYNMVRIIVGTLLQVGEGKRHPDDFKTILLRKERSAAGPTAMAHGLMLWEVMYKEAVKFT
ncbi:tRNA pseudouridine(38-40) synthase TruA [Paenibacillus thalictri]|uniref:tRNA pseudouridine synthase A n=1 Tax=Paenibacillus thalictri TaxID=2527873 RepID=A0A4Q9DEG2_9BACL|nr:tRNA pseudouridine(38-40) synthase TruA [Paenibacillus thalictri]TBL69217.1 tRNA pseudouridine(38-40) synthase TruA [Paenibacillus thalictri]